MSNKGKWVCGSRVSWKADKRFRERGAGCRSQERGKNGGRKGVQHRGDMAELGERGNESAGALCLGEFLFSQLNRNPIRKQDQSLPSVGDM